MKFTIIGILILFCFQRASAQQDKIKYDSVYYKLDTTSVAIKDRMFSFDQEAHFKEYILLCKCYPQNKDVLFYSNTTRPNDTKSISLEEFNQIKTVSITQLIEMAVNFSKHRIDKQRFFFIFPDGKNMKMTRVTLAEPLKTKAPIRDYIIIPPKK
ncbi:hypothetical protein TH53_26225 [Pedobacter lusitanus]|uniref:Uncharacterized protein n=1 Tax=Pedobacter lusitanus TaxID=1503925 RepID=A0A0D0GJA2_9SPHI|nr:hypothetical protein [Pedobacter lusitanus]KIO74471.1 hypothetical protein TH53_26225 [Pedobacter lusitanus]